MLMIGSFISAHVIKERIHMSPGRRMLLIASAVALTFLALAVPGTTAAQASTTICANQQLPSGYVVTSAHTSSACQGYLQYTISLPSNGLQVCAVNGLPLPSGWVVVGGTAGSIPQCASTYPAYTLHLPYNGILTCYYASPLPSPYVITAESSSDYPPCNGSPSATLYQETPGIVACQNTLIWNNYVVTRVSAGPQCNGVQLETLNPVYDGIIACGQGPGPYGYVVTRIWSGYPGCGVDEAFTYNLPYNGIHACSNSTTPAGYHVASYYTSPVCDPFEGETLVM
jgi:hypothetical protein